MFVLCQFACCYCHHAQVLATANFYEQKPGTSGAQNKEEVGFLLPINFKITNESPRDAEVPIMNKEALLNPKIGVQDGSGLSLVRLDAGATPAIKRFVKKELPFVRRPEDIKELHPILLDPNQVIQTGVVSEAGKK